MKVIVPSLGLFVLSYYALIGSAGEANYIYGLCIVLTQATVGTDSPCPFQQPPDGRGCSQSLPQ